MAIPYESTAYYADTIGAYYADTVGAYYTTGEIGDYELISLTSDINRALSLESDINRTLSLESEIDI